MKQGAVGLWITALMVAAAAATPANALPIYIEDNHAGTFYWLGQNIHLDESYTLILFDAHSDASGIFDSDKIRDVLRNVASTKDRQTLLDRWRSKGAVQCFNWIEPLMPAPFEKSFGCPPTHFRNLRFANIDSRQRHCSTAIWKQRRGNRDHFGSGMLFPIWNISKNRSTQISG